MKQESNSSGGIGGTVAAFALSAAAGLALGLYMWKRARSGAKKGRSAENATFDPVDQASRESFPASDAPPWR